MKPDLPPDKTQLYASGKNEPNHAPGKNEPNRDRGTWGVAGFDRGGRAAIIIIGRGGFRVWRFLPESPFASAARRVRLLDDPHVPAAFACAADPHVDL